MVVTLIEWEHLDSGKWKVKSKKVAAGKIDQDKPNYARRVKRAFEQIWIYCESCKEKYCLARPCMHHLSDSPEDRARYDAFKKKQRDAKSEHINSQTLLDKQ